jgi:hypothetical protein
MRTAVLLGALAVAFATTPAAQAPPLSRPVGTMSDLMVKIIYPASDAIFYIETRTPTSDAEWTVLQGQALMVAEAATLLMLPSRMRDRDQWMEDAKLMLDAGEAAYQAALRKDVAGLVAVNAALYQSCTTCHRHYRPNYGRGARPAR